MSSSLTPKPAAKPTANSAAGSAGANSAAQAAVGKMPGEITRGLVSLWLIFHLFCVALALVTNPSYDPPFSQLVGRLKMTFNPYMYALWIDAPHNYRFTYGEQQDADHILQANWVDSDGEKQSRQFPPADAKGEVRERYEALAQRAALPIYNESGDRSVLKGVGEGLIDQSGAKEVTFGIRRHSPLSIQDAVAEDPGQHDPNNQRTIANVYSGVVKLNSLGQGEVNNLNQEARDVAPVTNRSNRGAGRSPSDSGVKAVEPDAPPPAPSDSRHKPAPDLPPVPIRNGTLTPDALQGIIPKDTAPKSN